MNYKIDKFLSKNKLIERKVKNERIYIKKMKNT
jgi:hypothetical protein